MSFVDSIAALALLFVLAVVTMAIAALLFLIIATLLTIGVIIRVIHMIPWKKLFGALVLVISWLGNRMWRVWQRFSIRIAMLLPPDNTVVYQPFHEQKSSTTLKLSIRLLNVSEKVSLLSNGPTDFRDQSRYSNGDTVWVSEYVSDSEEITILDVQKGPFLQEIRYVTIQFDHTSKRQVILRSEHVLLTLLESKYHPSRPACCPELRDENQETQVQFYEYENNQPSVRMKHDHFSSNHIANDHHTKPYATNCNTMAIFPSSASLPDDTLVSISLTGCSCVGPCWQEYYQYYMVQH